jgi:hypothetical protein
MYCKLIQTKASPWTNKSIGLILKYSVANQHKSKQCPCANEPTRPQNSSFTN